MSGDALADVRAAIEARMPGVRADLESLVRIPSISAAGHDPAAVRRSADATASILTGSGFEGVRLLEVGDAHPYVYGERLGAPPGAPTVLLYAHHDVQPVATPERWSSPPFEPVERDGRLFGRGTADDKAGVMVHAAAVGAWLDARGGLPVDVKVVVEGEEEIGSPHLGEFLAAHATTMQADVIVLTDVTNWQVGWPGLTLALRGLAEVFLTVRTLEQPVHSGMWGGPVPDALTALVRLLATLHDEEGEPAVAGLTDDVRGPSSGERARLAAIDVDPAGLRGDVRMLDGVEWVGAPDRSLLERLWMRPTVTPIAIDAPAIVEASNQLVAEARAALSIRLAPGQDPDRVVACVVDHLERHAPWGAVVETEVGATVGGWAIDPEGPAFDAAVAAMTAAYGREPAFLGCGGTIPFVAPFADAFGGVPCLLTGIEDPATNAHGEDESLHLGDFERACLAEALLFQELAERLPRGAPG